MEKVEKPWGYYEVLYSDNKCKVKRLVIEDKKSISLQKHYKRNEHWVVVKGKGVVRVGSEEREIEEDDTVYIKKEEKHKVWGIKGLELIEVQTGELFSEEDIERYDSNM